MDDAWKTCGDPDNEKKFPPHCGLIESMYVQKPLLRAAFRLIERHGFVKSTSVPPQISAQIPVTVHRFEETIAGRAYQIEVTPVNDRWRAQIRRLPGMPTALMPFYGQTPDEAARQLTQWLTLAHQRIAAN